MNRVSKINIVFVSNNGNHIERIEIKLFDSREIKTKKIKS